MKYATSILLACTLILAGCNTFKDTSAKTITTVALTVDGAMKGWASWIVLNPVPADQENRVRTAYGQYQIAMGSAQVAYIAAVDSGDKSGWAQASAALQASQSGLLQLIQTFSTNKP